MGLDTTHDCWHGAYSAFMRWRLKIAEAACIPLPFMEGFFEFSEVTEDDVDKALAAKPYSQLSYKLTAAARDCGKNLPFSWKPFEHDPLCKLLHHSDCDGELLSSDCGPIADRLEQLLPLLPDDDGGGHIGNWRAKTQQFIDGLRLAASRNENVEFH